MDRFFNIVFGIILGLYPWVNVLAILGESLYQNKKKHTAISSLFLIAEVFLITAFFFDREKENNIVHSYASTIILITSVIYSIYFFVTNRQLKTYIITARVLQSVLASVFLIVVNNVGLEIIEKAGKRFKAWCWIQYIGLISTFYMFYQAYKVDGIPEDYVALTLFINFSGILIGLALTGRFNPTPKKIEADDQILPSEEQRIKPTNPSSEPKLPETLKPINTGWITDDTSKTTVTLSTIEDVITPISLKNEYEKSVVNLVRYIRKLKTHSDADIEHSLGKNGLSSYLEIFFSKMRFDAVRIVFIRSLLFVIEDYTKRDARVVTYYAKLHSMIKRMEIEIKK